MAIISRSQQLLLSISILILTGCGTSTINIEGSYPSPLVNKLPFTLGVYYDDSFKSHSFTEINERNGKDQYIINSGAAQVSLFNTVLPAAFEEFVLIDDINNMAAYPNVDLVFVPVIEAFQLGLPEKTQLDVYEIWIKYNMRLSQANGDYIADWVMTAYGKSPSDTSGSSKEAVNNAANIALRDLAATFSLGFGSIPGVREWLEENSKLPSQGL